MPRAIASTAQPIIKPPSREDFRRGTASPAEPMLWLRSEVTRTDARGHTWGANQRISVEEAIRCSTERTVLGGRRVFEA